MRGSFLTICGALCLLAVFVSGCRQVREVAKTEYRYIVQHDSVWRDCTDTVLIEKSGDTVRIFEKKTEKEYYYTYFRDTLRLSDTLRIERTTVQEGKNGGKAKPAVFAFFIGLCSGVILYFCIRLKKLKK